MRVLFQVHLPAGSGPGASPRAIQEFAEAAKPECMYFALSEGQRTMFAVLDLQSTSDMARLCEPLFSNAGATVNVSPCMNLEELKVGLSAIGRAP